MFDWSGIPNRIFGVRPTIATSANDRAWSSARPPTARTVSCGPGGALGSALLLLLPESAFVAVVPWLILFACALLALQEPIKRAVTGHAMGNHPAVLWGIQFLISIYGGYFGAGIGILRLAAVGILIPSSMQHANALKILLALLTNGTACLLFTLSGKVNFQVAALMTVASLAGGWGGALFAKRMSPVLMRGFAAVIGLAAAAKFPIS
jgi:uncharacterized membrane protein YfcA